jgi:tetratricopeptide (TPR) repeat protein
MLTISGCSSDAGHSTAQSKAQAPASSATFEDHLSKGKKFWERIKSGDEFRGRGDHNRAIIEYGNALNQYAGIRPEQAAALDLIAQTYEEMGDLKNAADNYELASQVTMNEDRQKSLKAKADQLRTQSPPASPTT